MCHNIICNEHWVQIINHISKNLRSLLDMHPVHETKSVWVNKSYIIELYEYNSCNVTFHLKIILFIKRNVKYFIKNVLQSDIVVFICIYKNRPTFWILLAGWAKPIFYWLSGDNSIVNYKCSCVMEKCYKNEKLCWRICDKILGGMFSKELQNE